MGVSLQGGLKGRGLRGPVPAALSVALLDLTFRVSPAPLLSLQCNTRHSLHGCSNQELKNNHRQVGLLRPAAPLVGGRFPPSSVLLKEPVETPHGQGAERVRILLAELCGYEPSCWAW